MPGIADEIRKARALKVFIGNLMTQPGETQDFTTSDHLEAIYSHAGNSLFDAVILNNKPISKAILARYKEKGSVPVVTDLKTIRNLGLTILQGDLLAQERAIRHDPKLLAAALFVAHKQWTTSELIAPGQTVSAKPMKNLRVLILAAGKGTRLVSNRAKVLHTLCGTPMLRLVYAAAAGLEPEKYWW